MEGVPETDNEHQRQHRQDDAPAASAIEELVAARRTAPAGGVDGTSGTTVGSAWIRHGCRARRRIPLRRHAALRIYDSWTIDWVRFHDVSLLKSRAEAITA